MCFDVGEGAQSVVLSKCWWLGTVVDRMFRSVVWHGQLCVSKCEGVATVSRTFRNEGGELLYVSKCGVEGPKQFYFFKCGWGQPLVCDEV